MSNIQTVREATQQCIRKAEAMFGVDMSQVAIRFDLKGAAAGMAGYRGRWGTRNYYLRFNTTMIAGEGIAHIINETVPHEIAHMVCFMDPRLGKNHDAGWARVCRALGGTGKRCHDEKVVYAKGKTYEYTCSQGTTIRLSEQRHNKIQRRGAVLNLKRGGRVDRNSAYRVVGISGRPVTQPTQLKPKTEKAPTMTTIETAVAANTADTTVEAVDTPVTDTVTVPTKAKTKTVKAKAAPKADKAPSKADLVRAAIARAKAAGIAQGDAEAEAAAQATVVAYAQAELEMKAAMAKRYVQENWAKA